jgi:RNA polymerase sigma factor (sigma-70 family)
VDDDDNRRFERLILPHLGESFVLARWLTGDRADAEDVVQEASLRAFRALDGYAGGNTRAWMLTIVRNTAYTWLAKNRNTIVTAVDDLELVERNHANHNPSSSGTDENPETDLLAKADAAKLDRAIAALPPIFREVLMLRHIQGLDYREIAAITDVPIGTVMSRLARARQRLVDVMRTD